MLIVSPIISSGSGSVAGLTLSRNKAGMYLRARAVPTNPNSPAQALMRNILQILADRFANVLGVADVDAWNVYAANTPLPAKLGGTMLVTGQNMFVRANAARAQAGALPIDTAPIIFDTGSLSGVTPSVAETGQTFDVSFDNADAWANDDLGRMICYLSRPQNANITYFKGPYTFAGVVEGNLALPPTSPVSFTVPHAVVLGQRVFARYVANVGDGRTTADFLSTTLVKI